MTAIIISICSNSTGHMGCLGRLGACSMSFPPVLAGAGPPTRIPGEWERGTREQILICHDMSVTIDNLIFNLKGYVYTSDVSCMTYAYLRTISDISWLICRAHINFSGAQTGQSPLPNPVTNAAVF